MHNAFSLQCGWGRLLRDGFCYRSGGTLLPILQYRGQKTVAEKEEKAERPRINELGIQMLSKPLYEHLFRGKQRDEYYSEEDVKRSVQHLKEKGLWGKTRAPILPDANVKLPLLYEGDLDKHFQIIAAVQGQAYLELANELCLLELPATPPEWAEKDGWTRYDPRTGVGETVECPMEDAVVLDVETCVMDNQRPVMAIALTKNGWYSWTSKNLLSGQAMLEEEELCLDHLIPLEPANSAETDKSSSRCRLIVGHGVGYDRARVREQYRIKNSNTRFLDTLSLHVCISGQANTQKGMWKAKNKVDETAKGKSAKIFEPWMKVSCPNSLEDLHAFYLPKCKKSLNKKLRQVFVKGTIQEIRSDFQNLMTYCSRDVDATIEVLKRVLPSFLNHCPNPVTFAGMLEMGGAYLPLNSSWKQYLDSSEYYYESIKRVMKASLMDIAKDACHLMQDKRYLKCPWLCNLDWETKTKVATLRERKLTAKCVHEVEKYYEKEQDGQDNVKSYIICSPKTTLRISHMNGYPNWYRALCMRRSEKNWRYGPVKITALMRATPYLLQMKWKGYPVHYHSKLGWGYIIDPDLNLGRSPEDSGERGSSSDESTKESLEVLYEIFNKMSLERDELVTKVPFQTKNKDLSLWSGRPKEKIVPSAEWKELGSEWGDFSEVDEEEETAKVVVEKGVDVSERGVVATPWGLTDDVVTLPNDRTYYFFKLPHMYGLDKNVGNPLSKDFLSKMEDGTLTSNAGQLGKDILIFNSMISFWRSSRSRVLSQFVVRTSDSFTNCDSEDTDTQYTIIPPVQVCGTITRRAVEKTWLTASNAKEVRVGSELKTLVRAPSGYHLVGADVDSEELWIAALFGDHHFTKIQGGTAISCMILQGNKVDQTDVHSMTAKTVGISRDTAKVLNYGRIYGAGRGFIETLLRTFNPSFTEAEVKKKVKSILLATKGRKGFCLNANGQATAKELLLNLDSNNVLSEEDWNFMIRLIGYRRVLQMVDKTMWVDGTESHLFNKIESIAKGDETKTPVLGCHITKALQNQLVGEEAFLTSRVNWVVQSSAVDYLHLLLTCVRWLFEYYKIDGRYCLSIHDEIRYLVKSEDRYRAALALQFANLYTRAMFAYKLGMYDLPQAVAFFSSVEIDTVLRKDPANDCVTPSNPEGLEKGHGIPPGEALDIYELIKLTNGSLEHSEQP